MLESYYDRLLCQDDYAVFKRVYETPILKSRAPDASAKEVEIGEARTAQILSQEKLDDLVQSSTAESLAMINVLTKVSNSPILLKATADKAKADSKDILKRSIIDDASRLIPDDAQIDDVTLSDKLPQQNDRNSSTLSIDPRANRAVSERPP
ncbi:hypothetical protein H0H93_009708 [Arthromyces matolae]|nr:hypothetical protein H0H93_009708 [Arthromyces matolae]